MFVMDTTGSSVNHQSKLKSNTSIDRQRNSTLAMINELPEYMLSKTLKGPLAKATLNSKADEPISLFTMFTHFWSQVSTMADCLP